MECPWLPPRPFCRSPIQAFLGRLIPIRKRGTGQNLRQKRFQFIVVRVAVPTEQFVGQSFRRFRHILGIEHAEHAGAVWIKRGERGFAVANRRQRLFIGIKIFGGRASFRFAPFLERKASAQISIRLSWIVRIRTRRGAFGVLAGGKRPADKIAFNDPLSLKFSFKSASYQPAIGNAREPYVLFLAFQRILAGNLPGMGRRGILALAKHAARKRLR